MESKKRSIADSKFSLDEFIVNDSDNEDADYLSENSDQKKKKKRTQNNKKKKTKDNEQWHIAFDEEGNDVEELEREREEEK